MTARSHFSAEDERLRAELEELRLRLDEAQQALEAIRTGQVESLVVEGPDGPRIFSLEGADHSYRVLVEAINEGAATLGEDGSILYCNSRFAEMLAAPLERVMGGAISRFLPERAREGFEALVREASGGQSRGELELLREDGELVPAYLSLSVIQDVGSSRLCLVAADLRGQKRSEEIMAAERLARSVLEQAAEAIIVCDDAGRVIRASSAAARLFGTNPLLRLFDELCVLSASSGASRQEVRLERLVAGALGGEVFRALPATLRRPDGSTADLLVSATALRGAGGSAIGCVINLGDISELSRAQRALQQSEARLRLLSRTAGLLLAAGDPQRTVDELCREVMEHLDCQTFFNYLVDEAPGRLRLNACAGITAQEAGAIQTLDFGVAVCGCVARDEQPLVKQDISSSADPLVALVRSYGLQAYCCHPLIVHGRLLGTLSFGTRTRARFTADEIELMHTVADQVAVAMEREQSKRALSAANAQLLETDRRKNEFLGVLSHELRNPLAPIRNSAYVLERAVPGGDQAKRALAVIDRQAGQLAHLVDDLLDVTRITQNKIQLQRETLELNKLVRRSMEDQRSLFEKAEVRLELDPAPAPVFVRADWNRLAQVVGNLLQNAAKFTGRGGVTRVCIQADAAAGRAILRVRDTGAGIAPELVLSLFEPFRQADCTLDRSAGGLGLGLTLVKALVELHGGEVTAHSAGLGKGAEFVVQLPLVLPAVAAPQLQASAPSIRRRLLVIEDNVDAAESLREVLELGEHEVEVAYTGPEGLVKARTFRPDVVLCDIGLPGMDGYAVARAFRADDTLKGARLVAVTGYALPEDLQRAQAAGFERHLAKPPSMEKLEELLANLSTPDDAQLR